MCIINNSDRMILPKSFINKRMVKYNLVVLFVVQIKLFLLLKTQTMGNYLINNNL